MTDSFFDRMTLIRVLAAICLGQLLVPIFAVHADICCPCKKEGKNICLTISTGGCATIQQTAKNPNLAGLTCDPNTLGDPNTGQCRLIADSGSCDVLTDAVTFGRATGTAGETKLVKPIPIKLNVQIPGLKFDTMLEERGGQLRIPFLAQYISAAYAYLLGITLITAAVVIVYGGFLYIIGSTTGSVSKGKKYIQNAIIGLCLVFGSYTILRTVNPATVSPQSLDVLVVQPLDFQSALFDRFGTTDADGSQASAGADGSSASIGDPSSIPPPLPDGPPVCPKPQAPGGINAWDRMQEVCAKGPFSKDSLINVVKTWKLEAVDKQGSGYIRGGSGGGTNAMIYPPQPGYMLSVLYLTNPAKGGKMHNYLTRSTMSACGIPPGLRFNGKTDNIAAVSPQLKELLKTYSGDKFGKKSKANPCFQGLEKDYKNMALYPVACNNMLATDCGLFTDQVLKCAGKSTGSLGLIQQTQGMIAAWKKFDPANKTPQVSANGKIIVATASNPGTITTVDGKAINVKTGEYIVPTSANCAIVNCKKTYLNGFVGFGKSASLAGATNIQFGAVVGLGCGANVSHYFLYTGKAGLDFETLESGGMSRSSKMKNWGVTFLNYLGDPKFHFGGAGAGTSFEDYINTTSCTDSSWLFYVNTL